MNFRTEAVQERRASLLLLTKSSYCLLFCSYSWSFVNMFLARSTQTMSKFNLLTVCTMHYLLKHLVKDSNYLNDCTVNATILCPLLGKYTIVYLPWNLESTVATTKHNTEVMVLIKCWSNFFGSTRLTIPSYCNSWEPVSTLASHTKSSVPITKTKTRFLYESPV